MATAETLQESRTPVKTTLSAFGRAVHRRALKRTVWSDEVEAGDALKKYIQRLRRKLGDDARNPLWIKNVHGVGYRFGAPSTNAA